MKVVKKWWWLIAGILAITLIVWKEERCQTQAYECRASYTAQAQSERLSGSVSVDQQASEQQAIAAACEPNGYLCRLFSATDLPAVFLVFIGMGGVWAASRTLRAIERQANIMEAQFQPRLHIDRIYATGLAENLQPIFFVKIVNSGIIAAEKVAISLKVELRDSIIQYSHDQVMTIPANSSVECFIRSGLILNFAEWKGLDSNILLRVSGHVIWGKKTIDYCYKYNPWPFENRPSELPLFVPCDFDTAITGDVNVRLTGIVMTASIGAVSIEAEHTVTETLKEPNEGT